MLVPAVFRVFKKMKRYLWEMIISGWNLLLVFGMPGWILATDARPHNLLE